MSSGCSISRADVIAVIPARYASTRFPGKLLAPLNDKPVLAHVVAAAQRADRVGAVLVATDHHEVAQAATHAGADVVMTREDHASGSDRIGEAITDRPESIVLNVQGDEPLVPPAAIDRLVELLELHEDAGVSTVSCPLHRRDDGPQVVKVVATAKGRALYFSRALIPAVHSGQGQPAPAWRHAGLYGYRRPVLERFLKTPPSSLELSEGLEQLRLLEMGETVVVGQVDVLPPGVDTPEDLDACRRWLASRGGAGSSASPSVGSPSDISSVGGPRE